MEKQQILQLLAEQSITPNQAKALLQGTPVPVPEVISGQLAGGRAISQDIAIVGIGLNLPGAGSKEQFWYNLLHGKCAINNLAKQRWQQSHYEPVLAELAESYGHWGGFLENIHGFDHGFFYITYEDAKSFDPQHKQLLQTSWHALEDAGLTKEAIAGSNCGVYIGINEADFADYLGQNSDKPLQHIDGWLASFAAGRVSYFYDLKGPALNIDTACSSSLVAVHNACRAIIDGDCEYALAGGTTVASTPHLFKRLHNLGIISPRGRCAPFDHQADGTVMGEGAAVLVLMPLAKAQQQNHRIHAVIKASNTNQDGRSNGISAPNGAAQLALLNDVYGAGKIDPASIGLFEAHGTGTNLGDPVELSAIAKVFSGSKTDCALGSVKANIGHTAQTAGLSGLIKLVMALKHKVKPPQINFHQLNDKIDLQQTCLTINTQAEHWSGEQVRRGAVNSFGIMGTNAHVVVEEYVHKAATPSASISYSHHLILLSAQSEAALTRKIEQLAQFIQAQPMTSLGDIAYTLASRREHFRQHRFALVADSLQGLLNALQMYRPEPPQKTALSVDMPGVLAELNREPSAALNPLNTLRAAYLNKAMLDWSALYPKAQYQVVDLPHYPFVVDDQRPQQESGDNQVYFLFAKYLGISEDELDVDAEFDELGIDSVSLMKVAAMLQIKFSLPITVETLITHSTPKAIYSFVNGMEYEANIDTNISINLEPGFNFMPYVPELTAETFTHPQLGTQEYMHGGRGTPILLMPPVDCPASAWVYQVRHLVKRHKVIVMHYPGYSHSEFRGFKVTLEQVADLVPDLLDHLHLSQVDVVGWSLGGLVAQILAAKHPIRLKKLILVNTAAHLNYLKNSESIEQLIDDLKSDFATFEDNIAGKIGVNSLASFIKGSTSNTVFLNYAREILNHNSITLLEHIQAPTWVIAGKNDKLTTLKHAQVLAERIEGAELVVHQSAGHYIPLANARYFNQKLDAFLHDDKEPAA